MIEMNQCEILTWQTNMKTLCDSDGIVFQGNYYEALM